MLGFSMRFCYKVTHVPARVHRQAKAAGVCTARPVFSSRGPAGSRCRSGQAIVELAFAGMVLAIILLGIYEILSMFNAYNAVVEATRVGARVVTLNYADTISTADVMQNLDAHGLNTVTGGQCDVKEIDIYEALDRGGLPAPVPVPMQRYFTQVVAGGDGHGGACAANTPSTYSPPFDQTVARWDLSIAAEGTAPAAVGLRVIYTYHYKTPVVSLASSSRTFTVSTTMPLGGDDQGNFQSLAVVNPPAPPVAPGQPGPVTVTFPGLCGETVLSPTVITYTGTITTSGIITGTGSISGSAALGYTRANPPTNTNIISSTEAVSGTGMISVTATTPVTETNYDPPYAPGGTTPGFQLSWTAPATGTVTGYLVYVVDTNQLTGVVDTSLVPGVYPATPFTSSSTLVYPDNDINITDQISSTVYLPYQPALSPNHSYAFYVVALNGSSESLPSDMTPASAQITSTQLCYPWHAPPTITPPPDNLSVTWPVCMADGTYPANVGVRLSWYPVADASGYLIYYVFGGVSSALVGLSPSNPWQDIQYPDGSATYDPSFTIGDEFKVTAIVNGVESQTPAYSSPAGQTCRPQVS